LSGARTGGSAPPRRSHEPFLWTRTVAHAGSVGRPRWGTARASAGGVRVALAGVGDSFCAWTTQLANNDNLVGQPEYLSLLAFVGGTMGT
jgi:hypothetical protein